MQLPVHVKERDPAFLIVQIHSYIIWPGTQVKDLVVCAMNFIIRTPLSYGEEAIFLIQSDQPGSGYCSLGNTDIPVGSQAHFDLPVVTPGGEALRPQNHRPVIGQLGVIGQCGAFSFDVLQTCPMFSHHEVATSRCRVEGD